MVAAVSWARRRWWIGAFVAGALIAVFELRAQPAPPDDAVVLAAYARLGEVMRNGDKTAARRLLALQFSFVDENGQVHARKDVLADLKGLAAAPAADAKVKTYGLVAIVSGHHKAAQRNEVFFLDIWAKQKGTWRSLVMQDVALAAAEPRSATAAGLHPPAKPRDCINPCQSIPYRVRSAAEQDIVNSFQAAEKALVTHDADAWSKHAADEFVLYRSGRAPAPRSARIAEIKQQKDLDAPAAVEEVQAMRLSVYGDAAAMIASHAAPDSSRPSHQALRVWVRRAGQWQMAVSAETEVK